MNIKEMLGAKPRGAKHPKEVDSLLDSSKVTKSRFDPKPPQEVVALLDSSQVTVAGHEPPDQSSQKLFDELMEVGLVDFNAAELLLAQHAHKRLENEEAPDSQKSHDEDDQEATMWHELRKAGFAFQCSGSKGNPIAGRWARHLKKDPDFKANYNALPTMAKKASLRQEWCNGQYTKFVESKTHSQSYTIKEKVEGTFLSLHRIAVEEGGGETGMKAAINYCLRCVKEGSGWVEYNEWTKGAKYNYVVKKKSETHGESWQKSKSWQNEKSKEASTASLDDVAVATGRKRKKNETAAGTTPKSGKVTTGEETANPSPGKADKDTKAKSFSAQAQKTKSFYNQAMRQANMLVDAIDKDAAWEEFRGGHLDKLKKAIKAVTDHLAVDFNKQVMTMELSQIKKGMDAAAFDRGCKAFCLALEGPCTALAKESKKLVKQHQAGVDVDKE